MRFMMLVTFTDLGDERPRVVVEFIEAVSQAEAVRLVEDLTGSAHKLMDLAVCDWRDTVEWKDLDGDALLKAAGYAFGTVEAWSGERLFYFAETPFGPCDLEPYQGQLGPVAPPPPGQSIPFSPKLSSR